MAGTDLNFSYSGRHPMGTRVRPLQQGLITGPHTPWEFPFHLLQSLASNSFSAQSPPAKNKSWREISERKVSQEINKRREYLSRYRFFVNVLGFSHPGVTGPTCITILSLHVLFAWSRIPSPLQLTWKIVILCLAQWLKNHLYYEAILDSLGRVRCPPPYSHGTWRTTPHAPQERAGPIHYCSPIMQAYSRQ